MAQAEVGDLIKFQARIGDYHWSTHSDFATVDYTGDDIVHGI